MGNKKKQSAFDLSVQNESLNDLMEPKYIVRNFYSSPLIKNRFSEDDLYAREEREYRRMLRKAHKKQASTIPAYSFSGEYTPPSPIVIPASQDEDVADLFEKVLQTLETRQNQEQYFERHVVSENVPTQDEIKSHQPLQPELEDKITTNADESPAIEKITAPEVKIFKPVPEEQKEYLEEPRVSPTPPQTVYQGDDEIIKIPEDPFFPETKNENISLKSRMSIKYDTDKNEKPTLLKRQNRDGSTKEKGSKLPSKRRFKEKTPGEKELELKRITELINLDGYYDNRVPADDGIAHKTVRKGYYIKLALLCGLTLAVLIGFICYLIFWF
jgi:hypothetical protein